MSQYNMFVSKQLVLHMQISVKHYFQWQMCNLFWYPNKQGQHTYYRAHLFVSHIIVWLSYIVSRQNTTIFKCKCWKTKSHWQIGHTLFRTLFTQLENKCKIVSWASKYLSLMSDKIIWFGCILNSKRSRLVRAPAEGFLFPRCVVVRDCCCTSAAARTGPSVSCCHAVMHSPWQKYQEKLKQ